MNVLTNTFKSFLALQSDLIKINVKDNDNGNIKTLNVATSTSIKEIKDQTDFEPLEDYRLLLVHDGRRLEDEFTLSYYGICDNSTLIIYKYFPCDQSPVQELEDDVTLAECNIKRNSYLYQILRPVCRQGRMEIRIKTLLGEMLALLVHPSDSTEYLKAIIFAKRGYPKSHQRLIFAGEQLEDGRTLASYNIRKAAIIYCVLRLRGGNDFVHLSMPSGKVIILNVELKVDNIEGLKQNISWKAGIPENKCQLTFNNQLLEDEMKLLHYGIKSGSTISLKTNYHVKVIIKTYNGMEIAVEAEPTDVIAYLRDKIQSQEGIASDKYRLEFEGEQLEDRCTLMHYGIEDQSVLHLKMYDESFIKIFVDDYSDVLTLHIDPRSTIADVKIELEDRLAIPTCRIGLFSIGDSFYSGFK